jgi:transcriptional regulator with XRE-family HTH domain
MQESGNAEEPVWVRKLRALVEAHGGNRKGVCRAAGVNETFIRDILDRHQDPGVSKIVKLARFHGVPPSWFFTEGDDHPIDEDRERIIRLIESLPQEDRAEVEKIGLGFLLRHLRRDEALQDLPAKVNK